MNLINKIEYDILQPTLVHIRGGLIEEGREIGRRRTEANTKWQKRSKKKQDAIQQGQFDFTVDELGAIGELVVRQLCDEEDLKYFSPLLNEGDTGISAEEQRPDIQTLLVNADIKTVDSNRKNVSVQATHLESGSYDNLVVVQIDFEKTVALVQNLCVYSCEKIRKEGETVNGYKKMDYYLIPLPTTIKNQQSNIRGVATTEGVRPKRSKK